MKTYISLIKHKVHWLHLASFTVVLGVFTSVALQQYANQVFYQGLSNQLQPTSSAKIRSEILATAAVVQPPKPATEKSGQPAQPGAPTTPVAATPAKPTAAAPSKGVTPTLTPSPAPAPVTQAPANPARTTVGDIAPESACPGQGTTANVAGVVACMTAYARSHNGVGPISNNGSLVAAAEAKVQDMASCGYSHTACGRPFNYWYSVKGFSGNCSAENIAQGQQTSGEVFTAWMNSPGHRANILNPSYQYVGVAYSSNGGLWAMALGGC